MKGIWASDKSVNVEYKPALDALKAMDAALLASAIAAVLADGGAVMFSATRDYGAICVTLLNGNDRHKVYPSNVQELQQAMSDLRDSFEAPPNTTARKAAPKR